MFNSQMTKLLNIGMAHRLAVFTLKERESFVT